MKTPKPDRTGQIDRTARRAGRRAPLKDLASNKTKDVKGGRGRYQLQLDEAQKLINNK